MAAGCRPRFRGFPPLSDEVQPRCGVTLGGVKRPQGTLVPRWRQAPDGGKEGGSQPTASSVINRRVFLAPALPMHEGSTNSMKTSKKWLPTLDIGSHSSSAGRQARLEAPGSQGMLPYPSPLRTVHESRPSHSSSPCCLLSMSLVVCVMTPPMYKHAVLLAIVPTLVFGGDVVIVDRIAVLERHLA
jgi:hypothetical protein